MKKICLVFLSLLSLNVFAYNAKNKELVIGATVGDFADMVKNGIAPILKTKGYSVKLIEFSDYVTPNIALAQGSLDANIFQHKPYLEQFAKEKGLSLYALAQVPTAPLGLYAGKIKSLEQVKQKSTIAIPNDATNLARALVMLRDLGWIKLKANTNLFLAGTGDIIENSKELKIVLLEAAQLPRSLQDVDFAVINGNYVTSSGMKLTSSLFMEKSDSYVNWIAVDTKNKDLDYIQLIKNAVNSKEFKEYSKKNFKGYKYPTVWK